MVANHPDMPAPPNPHRLKWQEANTSYNLPGRTNENPKDKAGSAKVGMHVIPPSVLMQIALALEEGELKYSGYNWRAKDTPITYSKYYDAVMRHMSQHFEGEDIDAPSGVSHIIKAAATLIVLYDAMQQHNVVDDRPKAHVNPDWLTDMNEQHVELVKRVTEAKEAKC